MQIWKENTDSTSKDVLRLSDSLSHGDVVAAMYQSQGRGQGDHKWHSSAGQNLLFSIFLKYGPDRRLDVSGQRLLSMASALSACDFLDGYGICAQIKEPNDIYVEGRKICGMLIENSILGGEMKTSCVGMGINVNETDFPDGIISPHPTSIRMLKGGEYDIRECLDRFLGHFFQRFSQIWDNPTLLQEEFRGRLISHSANKK